MQKLVALKQYSETTVVFARVNVLGSVANIGLFSFIQIVPPATHLHYNITTIYKISPGKTNFVYINQMRTVNSKMHVYLPTSDFTTYYKQ